MPQTGDALLAVQDLVKHYAGGGLFRAVRAAGARRGWRLVRGRPERDAGPGGRERLRQVHRGTDDHPPAGADRGPDVVRGPGRLRRSTAGAFASSGGGCRSSSRIPTAASTRA